MEPNFGGWVQKTEKLMCFCVCVSVWFFCYLVINDVCGFFLLIGCSAVNSILSACEFVLMTGSCAINVIFNVCKCVLMIGFCTIIVTGYMCVCVLIVGFRFLKLQCRR